MNLLIVDDSAMMRAMIRRVVGLSGVPVATVFEAADGAKALEVLDAHEVHVMLTDLNMPVMTGWELLEEIARRGRWPGLASVVISSDGSTQRRSAVSSYNVRRYLEKPLNPEVIGDVLNECAESCGV